MLLQQEGLMTQFEEKWLQLFIFKLNELEQNVTDIKTLKSRGVKYLQPHLVY